MSTEVNASPLCIADMDQPTQIYLNSHNAPSNIKEFLTIKPKPTTQVGCIPLVRQKEGSTQTDKPTEDCHSCKNEEHLIMQRQAYIHIDAVHNLSGDYDNPITSREDRHKMALPNRTAYKKWMLKF